MIYYRGPTRKRTEFLPEGYVGSFKKHPDVAKLAVESFTGYQGHYHADPLLPKDQCTDVYREWSEKFTPYVIEKDGLAAYGGISLGEQVELLVGGVSAKHRGKGLYRQLVIETLDQGFRNDIKEAQISTQITNTTVQRAWCELGLKPYKSFYTLHYHK